MKSLKFVGAGVLGLTATLIGVVIAALILIACTETGLRLAWPQAKAVLPATIQIGAVDGRLIGPLTLHDINIHGEARDIHVDTLRLHWSPGALFQGVVAIGLLQLDGVNVIANPNAPPSEEPTTLPERYPLPLQVRVDQLAVNDISYRAAPDAEPVPVRHVGLALSAGADAVDVRDIRIDAPLLDLRGKLHVVPGGAYPLAGELAWHLRPEGYAEAAGETSLSGSLRELHVTQKIAAPYNLDARATVHDVLDDLAFSADLSIGDMRLAKIRADLQPIALTLDGHFEGRPDNARYTLSTQIESPEYGTFHANAKGDYHDQTLAVEALAVTRDGVPTRITGQGRVALGGEAPRVDASLAWHEARWPLQGEPTLTSPEGQIQVRGTVADAQATIEAALGDHGRIDGRVTRRDEHIALGVHWQDVTWPLSESENQPARVRSPKGSLQVDGTLDDYRLQLAARVDVPGQTGGHVRVEGQGDSESLALSTVDIETLGGRIEGQARAAWKPAVAFAADLRGRGIDPGVLLPQWPGKIDFRVDARGEMADSGLHADVETLSASGTLRGQRLQVNAKARYDAPLRIEVAKLDATLGSSRISAHGHVDEEALNLDWAVRSDDLGKLLPQLGGSLDAEGHAGGTRMQPQVRLSASGRNLRYDDYHLNTLRIDADVDASGRQRSHVTLNASGGSAAGVEIKALELNGQGTPRDHQLKLALDSSRGDANLALHGDFHDARWSFRLDTARLVYPDLAPWHLAAPASGLLSRDVMRLSQACWASGEARLCLQGERTDKGMAGKFKLDHLAFAYFKTMLPPDLAADGTIAARGHFEQPGGGAPRGQLQLTTSAGALKSTAGNASATLIAFEPSRITASLDATGMHAQGAIDLKQRGHLKLALDIPDADRPFSERPLHGQVSADIDDIGFAADLVPQVGRLSGSVHGQLKLSGSIAEPRILGRLKLADGAATLNGPGLDVTDIQAELAGRDKGGIYIAASARSGGGTLSVNGNVDVAGHGPQVDLQIRGDAFQVFNTADGHVWASPDLTVEVRDRRIRVNGQVTVPRARITPQELPKSAVTVSSDQVIVQPGKRRTARTRPYEIYAKVRLILGDDVHVEAFGLKGRLAGDLLVNAEPGEPPRGSGELRIEEGEYRAYGQGLVIERGRILFADGPLSQPGVDVRAIRHPAEGITVGVQVQGSLKNPQFSLFSDPGMSQSEQLSWLVLGRPLENTSSSESSLITRAALALGISGSNALTKKLSGAIGVDTLGIETGSGEAGSASNPEQAAFVIGKYLSPDLYVSYGIGLFEPVSTVKLQYTLSSKWKLATEASTIASGGDLIYTIERGH